VQWERGPEWVEGDSVQQERGPEWVEGEQEGGPEWVEDYLVIWCVDQIGWRVIWCSRSMD
jgi:hypothetical protein